MMHGLITKYSGYIDSSKTIKKKFKFILTQNEGYSSMIRYKI
jgi:hypothetical protein